jgi:hypothetical protein
MSNVEEIERLIEQLPADNFKQLADWMEQKLQRPSVIRDHGAFLNSYAPEDEGLYDDAAAG